MPRVSCLVLLALPFLELYSMFRFSAAFGFGSLLTLILLTAVIGMRLMARARQNWVRQTEAMITAVQEVDPVSPGGDPAGGTPHQRMSDPAAIPTLASAGYLWVAGLLLLLPGVIGDGCGLLLAIPWTRQILHRLTPRPAFGSIHFQASTFGVWPAGHRQSSQPDRWQSADDNNERDRVIDAANWSQGDRSGDNENHPRRLS